MLGKSVSLILKESEEQDLSRETVTMELTAKVERSVPAPIPYNLPSPP